MSSGHVFEQEPRPHFRHLFTVYEASSAVFSMIAASSCLAAGSPSCGWIRQKTRGHTVTGHAVSHDRHFWHCSHASILVYLIITGELAANNFFDKLIGVVWRSVNFHVFSAL
jgi:hypothetical protein